MEKTKKEFAYVGLVGRNKTGAVAMITKDNLKYRENSCVYKFSKENYYEAMYILAAKIVSSAIENGTNIVLYSIDPIINNTRKFFAEYKFGQTFDYEAFAEQCVKPKRKFNHYNAKAIEKEKAALVSYLLTVTKCYIAGSVTIKFEKAKEVDQLVLQIPKGTTVKEGDIISFTDGATKDGITVYGWKDYSRKAAVVKARYERGSLKPVYFIYRNDRTPLGKSKSDMLRYLWSVCPTFDETKTEELYRVA